MTEQKEQPNDWENELPILGLSYGANNQHNNGRQFIKWSKTYAFVLSAKLLVLVQIILSFRHVQLSVRFTTNISFDILFHHLIYNVCDYFRMNYLIYKLLDFVLLAVILVYAVDLILEHLTETKKIYSNIFDKKDN